MVDGIVTDTHQLTIAIIEHGFAKILNVDAPTAVEKNTPFDIDYDLKNESTVDDMLWTHIKNTDTGEILPDSYWEGAMAANFVTAVHFPHPGIDTSVNLTIEAGYKTGA